MKPNMHPISNRMFLRTRLSYSPRPISTALVDRGEVVVGQEPSPRLAWLPRSPSRPIAIPMSAFFSAGASLTPSPVMATIWPSRLSTSTRRTLCSGVTRGDHADIGDRLHRLVIGHRAELRPGDDLALDAKLAGDRGRGNRMITGDHADLDPGGLRPARSMLWHRAAAGRRFRREPAVPDRSRAGAGQPPDSKAAGRNPCGRWP